jgi:hypothetical protein
MNMSLPTRRETVFLLILALGAFAIRAYRVGAVSLAEDETAKWEAIQLYRQGNFAGVNREHPMLMKLLAWGSLEIGERWNRFATVHSWPLVSEEGWLRLPNLLLGAATTWVLYILGREMMGPLGAGAAAFFWAFTPLPIALNRVLKEDTPLTFFTLLAFYCYSRAKRARDATQARKWLDGSGVCFGLALASKYIIYLFGLNALVWHIAGSMGLDRRPLGRSLWRVAAVMTLVFVLANPVVLSPTNLSGIVHYAEGKHVDHNGYNLDGRLYMNSASFTPYGMPWYFYLWVLALKTPLPVLGAFLAGAILLLRERRTMPSIYFRALVLIYLLGLSTVGAKWIRYVLSVLPFVFLTCGYAVERLCDGLARSRKAAVALPVYAFAAVLLFIWPLAEALRWAPYDSLYLNALGGGRANAARFFPHDEIYDLGTREAVEAVAKQAPARARLAAANPMTVGYYLQRLARTDIQVVPIYDGNYVPHAGDVLLVQEARRYFETDGLQDLLIRAQMPHRDIYVGDLQAAQIYSFEICSPARERGPQAAEGDAEAGYSQSGRAHLEARGQMANVAIRK